MAKKEKEEVEDKKGAKASKGEERAESPDKAGKRSKAGLILGIAGIAFVALGGGGFFTYKTFLAKPPVAAVAEVAKDAHGEAAKPAADAHGEAGKPAADAHGEAGKPAADAHGEAKPGAGAPSGAEGASAKDKKPKRFGDIFSIAKMEVNVGGADLGRGYVRLSLSLEYDGEKEQKEELEQRSPQIKDIVINVVSARPKNELLNPKGKEDLRRQLLNKINEVTERPITSLYFTEFLVE